MASYCLDVWGWGFLSIQAQDFIEEKSTLTQTLRAVRFLSIQAQDFIEDRLTVASIPQPVNEFLSIQAQDFIEDRRAWGRGLP